MLHSLYILLKIVTAGVIYSVVIDATKPYQAQQPALP
jgi:hypothetical protein